MRGGSPSTLRWEKKGGRKGAGPPLMTVKVHRARECIDPKKKRMKKMIAPKEREGRE